MRLTVLTLTAGSVLPKSMLFEIALVLVRFYHVARCIVNGITRFCSLLCRASALRVLKSRD